ncbi:MAG: mannose-1-phosphate guanylyltransferase/mannose-6-phosphate isomerase [Gammaproteobacteria bacterium]
MNIQPVILSGGSGSRLWPMSREHYPKQLLPLVGDKTMLQATVQRLEGLQAFLGEKDGMLEPIVVCNEEHRFLVAEQLRQIGTKPSSIILEPVGRNTAPALALAAINAESAGDPVLLVMPADHVIQNREAFLRAVAQGAVLAGQGRLVTFGILPDRAETGYGYIQQGSSVGLAAAPDACYIGAFVEKPDAVTAEDYWTSGQYLWNSGIFMMRASVWLQELFRFRPDIVQSCQVAYQQGKQDQDFYRVNKAAFSSCPSDSIDYAVMEKLTSGGLVADNEKAAVIPLDAGWSDVGAWAALWEVSDKDEHGNVIKGDVYTHGTRNTLLIAEHRFLACVGVNDIVVIETPDAVMVVHQSKVQDVKQIVAHLKDKKRSEYLLHRKVSRPWGSYDSIDNGERFQVKRIVVSPGGTLSMQMHHHRAEHWIVVKGTARVTRGDEVFLLTENQSTYIPIGVTHRLENPGTIPLELIEVQSGSYLGEDDIVRFEDTYGRS